MKIKKKPKDILMSELDIFQHLFVLVWTIFSKKVEVSIVVGSLPISSMKTFLLDSSVHQGDTDSKNIISIDLPLTISPVAKNSTQDLKHLYDMANNSDL